MRRIRTTILVAVAVPVMSMPLLAALRPTPSAQTRTDRISACSLLTREEVKKLMPWPATVDNMPNQEDAIGETGSACEYPSVSIQLLAYTPQFLATVKKNGKYEKVADLGDEAYFQYMRTFGAMHVKVGNRLITVQKILDAGQPGEAAKPSLLAFARALIAKLP